MYYDRMARKVNILFEGIVGIVLFLLNLAIMFESGTHSIPRRIVSLAQPWVRPIVRGKAHASTEFGAKMHISLVDGYARIERLDFEAYNEAEDFWKAVYHYVILFLERKSIKKNFTSALQVAAIPRFPPGNDLYF